MSNTQNPIEPEVEALSDYMEKRGLDPQGAEALLVSTALRWFMGELGIVGDGAFAASIRKAFVNQVLFIVTEHDDMRQKFGYGNRNVKAEVSNDENR